MKQRILRVVTLASATGKYGGPFDTATRQASLAQVMGFDAALMAGSLANDAPTHTAESANIELIFPRVRRLIPGMGFAALSSLGMVRELRKEVSKADLIHVSASRELIPLITMGLCVIMKKPFVAQPHGMLTSRTSVLHRLLDRGVRKVIAKATSVLVLTEVEAADLIRWFGGEVSPTVVVLGNPIPTGVEPSVRSKAAVQEALFVARLHPRKRVEIFAAAARIAHDRGWEEHYTIVGPDGGDLSKVELAVRDNPSLHYEGAIGATSVTARVQSTGVFVLPSENEPWGNVLALAIASGVPVVVSESAALSQPIIHYAAGRVIPDSDAEAMADAIHQLLSHDELYEQANSGAQQMTAERLSADLQLETLRRVYVDAVG